MQHRILGTYIRDYRAGHGVPMRIKLVALLLLWSTILSSVLFVIDTWWMQLLALVIAAGVTLHLCRLPTRKMPPVPRRTG